MAYLFDTWVDIRTTAKNTVRLCVLLGVAALCSHRAAATTPLQTPGVYVTGNHGLRVVVPRGLYYCPIPKSRIGSDHGTILFLNPPTDCDSGVGSRISIYYGFNVAEHDHGDGDERPAKTDAELRQDECSAGTRVSMHFWLLGHAVAGCVVQEGSLIMISANAVYSLERLHEGVPDHTLAVTLYSSPERLRADLATFRRVLAGISICTPRWAETQAGRQACREWAGSWW